MKNWEEFDLSAESSAGKHILQCVYISREINTLQRYSNKQIHSRVDQMGFYLLYMLLGSQDLSLYLGKMGKINAKEGTG